MKKLLTFVSAITAGAIGSAAADVSVSGAGNFYYSSAEGDATLASQEKSMSVSGGAINFAMSTETTNGVTVTGSASITQDSDDVTTAGVGGAVGGMHTMVFGMDGMTISLGDIDNAGSGTGEGGDIATFASTHAALYVTDGGAAASDSAMDAIADGHGINISTSMGVASVDATFVSKVGSGKSSFLGTATTTGYSSGYAVNVGFDMAGAAINVAAGGSQAKVVSAKDNSAFAVEASYPVSDALSISVGGSNGTIGGNDEDNVFASATYTMDADTTLKLGIGQGDNTTSGVLDKASVASINLSRSLGGGVSVFAEYASISEDSAGVKSDATAMTVGTSVAF
jgi:hypothetical protein